MNISQTTLRRRGWIVPLCVGVVVAAALVVAGSRTTSYRTQAVLVVPANGGPQNHAATPPGTLATTYAELIGQDDHVVAAVARAAGLPASVARTDITAVQVPGTSIIDVAFTDASASGSAAGEGALVAAITGPRPVAASIPAGALQLVSAPNNPSKQGRKVPGGPVPVGIVLGLFLGIAVLIAWDRHDSRVDNPRTLEHELGVPVTKLGPDLSNGSLQAVQQRWRRLIERPGVVTVALVNATPESDSSARLAHARLCDSECIDAMVYQPAQTTGRGANGDLVAMKADLVVLVVSQGDRMRDIRSTVHALSQLGAKPQWAILTDPS